MNIRYPTLRFALAEASLSVTSWLILRGSVYRTFGRYPFLLLTPAPTPRATRTNPADLDRIPGTIKPNIEGVELASPHSVSADQSLVAAIGPDHKIYLYPTEGGEPQPVQGAEIGDIPVRWSSDGGALFIRQRGKVPTLYTAGPHHAPQK